MTRKAPDAFRTISEVADWLGVNAHVLRFWESKFAQVKPVKRAGGRRYYRPADMELLGGIRKLLHEDGMTIKGAQKVLREKGLRYVSSLSHPVNPAEPPGPAAVETAPRGEPERATPVDVAATEAPEPDKVERVEAKPEPVTADVETAPAPSESAQMALFSHRIDDAPAPSAKPSLPKGDLTVLEALSELSHGQVDPDLLAPVHARLVALRDRMGAAG